MDITPAANDDDLRRLDWVKSIPFFFVHVVAVVGVFWLGFSWSGLALAMFLYFLRMFGVTAGYHRYFSHRTYKTSRWFQFLLALLAVSTVQKGVLWWASHHRLHHRVSDQPGDVHSVKQNGFWWSHMNWILSNKHNDTDQDRVKDLMKYPELVWFDKWHHVPVVALAVGLFLIGGWWALIWGFFVSTSLLWHGTFTINSLTHVFGKQRYVTGDNSRNHWFLALITMGEGWHNNHHYYQRATNQGFFWWEVDVTYYILRGLQAVGLVWDIHTPPKHVLESNRVDQAPAAQPVVAETAPVLASSAPPALDSVG
jgi:stearoyl-CoA desaturase (delta-9 desaturase)